MCKKTIFSRRGEFRRKSKVAFIVLFFLSFLTCFNLNSCGYRCGTGSALENYTTVCIPYAGGDNRGIFTAAMIRALTAQGALAYRAHQADLVLKVDLLSPEESNIGFIYAPPDKGDNEASHIVVANEARLNLAGCVTLTDRGTGACILGPIVIRTWLDYDFEPDLSNVNEHAFALGQLEMHNLAQDAAFFPLYTLLAEKIVDYLNNSW